jgi:hypothetical protein
VIQKVEIYDLRDDAGKVQGAINRQILDGWKVTQLTAAGGPNTQAVFQGRLVVVFERTD